MASDSPSQESLDQEEYDLSARKMKAKPVRTRTTPNRDSSHDADLSSDRTVGDDDRDHESPSRLASAASRIKDTKRSRPNHLLKGKTAKDKRKLREKRRSTGVVHLPSTESTGDSLDEDDETKKNTSINSETGLDDDNPETPVENNLRKQFGSRTRNKSPSQTDLEADLEDNQDYDSTVSQSETNLTTIGQSETVFKPISLQSVGQSSSENHRSALPANSSQEYSRQTESHTRLHENNKPASTQLHTEFNRLSYTPKYKELNVPKITGYLSNNAPIGFRRVTTGVSNHNEESKLAARNRELEKLLKEEKDDNKKLREMLAERDSIIRNLEREIALMNKDLDLLDEENEKLHEENKALIRAMSHL